jgi:L-amino acid N-acyltransferase
MNTTQETRIGIRDAADADLHSIVAIVNCEIAESPFIWREEPTTIEVRQAWLDEHRRLRQPVVVATDGTVGGRVVGWASLSSFRAGSGYRFTCEVSIYVARDMHRRGIGRRLITELHERARALGIRAVVAAIDVDHTSSIELFRSFGYREAGRLNNVGWKFGEWRSEVFLLKHLD